MKICRRLKWIQTDEIMLIEISMEILMAKFWKAMNEPCVVIARTPLVYYKSIVVDVVIISFFYPHTKAKLFQKNPIFEITKLFMWSI